jgi:hypothetical protein
VLILLLVAVNFRRKPSATSASGSRHPQVFTACSWRNAWGLLAELTLATYPSPRTTDLRIREDLQIAQHAQPSPPRLHRA